MALVSSLEHKWLWCVHMDCEKHGVDFNLHSNVNAGRTFVWGFQMKRLSLREIAEIELEPRLCSKSTGSSTAH